MTDYNVSDHWSEDEPAWVKSLASSLDRRHGLSTVLPLTVILDEITSWVELASGEEAWDNSANRKSLHLDLEQSVRAVGSTLRAKIDTPLKRFSTAFANLTNGPRTVLKQPAGQRTNAAWTGVVTTAADLLECLVSDEAVGASWDDLVATAQDRSRAGREYRPFAELLYDQLRRRGLDADRVFGNLVAMVAYGAWPEDLPIEQGSYVAPEERVANARAIACTPAENEHVVVWLGYQGRVSARLNAGRVTFLDAHWAVPNVAASGKDFQHKRELDKLVDRGQLFKVAGRVGEESDVDVLVRVDLGETHAAGAKERAVEIVETIMNVSLYYGGGIRPHLAQYGILCDGEVRMSSFMVSRRETGFSDDRYGAGMTADSIDQFGPQIADALARQQLPRFLAAALEAQTTADRPFSRDFALREPSEADIASVVPLADRVVQHVAAHAALAPASAFEALGKRWPHARWLTDVRRAVGMCLVGRGQERDLQEELTREWYNPSEPWILFASDRADDLLSVCLIESERAWIERMLHSVSDHASYAILIAEYQAEGDVLDARRRRVRNALVHGNPAHFAVITSVREYSDFLSGSALHFGLESYVAGTDPATALAERTDEYKAVHAGMDAAMFWRGQTDARA